MTAKEWLAIMQQAEDYNPAMTKLIEKYGEMILAESGQPLPDDLNSYIEQEADRIYGMLWHEKTAFRLGAKNVASLLLPQLQQAKEEIKRLSENWDEYDEMKKDYVARRKIVEEQQQTIDELKAKLEHYRNETGKVQKFVYDRKDIGLPCQPIFDAIKDFIDEQAVEIESLKRTIFNLEENGQILIEEIESLKQEVKRLEKELEGFAAFKRNIDEALNSGDGVYRP